MVTLPFPPSSLSGHAKGHWRTKAAETKKWRAWAHAATIGARQGSAYQCADAGDIPVTIRFTPPNRRSDRANFPNRLKPILDGIADALGVNDRRFLPSYQFCEPEAPGKVEIVL
ncbi:hypothetical protein [Novosphingobium sp. Leaf2]|uniref:hypothetical protein n=1 Tax=Novosphingobium sp. Leaf2 TaxID=1735670 RepID=UPI0006F909D3|nr:hypothetical protein [Novosphingobium sp. Leaf2]KQM18394.1 hypothetical protein ASE49_09290 [Novosphingobium sp. Leaf2]